MNPSMPIQHVVQFLHDAADAGIDLRVDGGWSVDALLGEQTRAHADLDVVIEQRDVSRLRDWLGAHGFRDVARDDTSTWNFVLGEDAGHQIDVHVITLDEAGNGLYGPPERGVMYPAESLTGVGRIGALTVTCISPEWLVRFHTGYELQESDLHDVGLLCRRFGIEPLDEYRHLRPFRAIGDPQRCQHDAEPLGWHCIHISDSRTPCESHRAHRRCYVGFSRGSSPAP